MGLIVDELEISPATNLEIVNKLKMNNDYIYVAGEYFLCFKKWIDSGAGDLIKLKINAENYL